MNLNVVGSPEDENEMEEYIFQFIPSALILRLSGFRRYVRDDEFAPWRLSGQWIYPDLQDISTLTQPEPPQWAILDARTRLFEAIKIE